MEILEDRKNTVRALQLPPEMLFVRDGEAERDQTESARGWRIPNK